MEYTVKRRSFYIVAILSLLVVLVIGYDVQAGDKCFANDGKAQMTSCCQKGGDKGCVCKDGCCTDSCINKGQCDDACKATCTEKTAASSKKSAPCKPGECKPSECKIAPSK